MNERDEMRWEKSFCARVKCSLATVVQKNTAWLHIIHVPVDAMPRKYILATAFRAQKKVHPGDECVPEKFEFLSGCGGTDPVKNRGLCYTALSTQVQ